jgi:hypothetical protein
VSTIYVVIGTRGEWSDRSEWLVRAFANEDAAKTHVVHASGRAKELHAWRDANDDGWGYSDDPAKPTTNDLDPKFFEAMSAYDETEYYYRPVELVP